MEIEKHVTEQPMDHLAFLDFLGDTAHTLPKTDLGDAVDALLCFLSASSMPFLPPNLSILSQSSNEQKFLLAHLGRSQPASLLPVLTILGISFTHFIFISKGNIRKSKSGLPLFCLKTTEVNLRFPESLRPYCSKMSRVKMRD